MESWSVPFLREILEKKEWNLVFSECMFHRFDHDTVTLVLFLIYLRSFVVYKFHYYSLKYWTGNDERLRALSRLLTLFLIWEQCVCSLIYLSAKIILLN